MDIVVVVVVGGWDEEVRCADRASILVVAVEVGGGVGMRGVSRGNACANKSE